MEPDIRDEIVIFIVYWKSKTERRDGWFRQRIDLRQGRFIEWKNRLNLPNFHNGQIPKEHWLLESEKDSIESFYLENREDGYRRRAYIDDRSGCSLR